MDVSAPAKDALSVWNECGWLWCRRNNRPTPKWTAFGGQLSLIGILRRG